MFGPHQLFKDRLLCRIKVARPVRPEIPFEFSLRVLHDQKEGFSTLPLVAISSTQPRDTSCEVYCSRVGSASFSSTKRETLNICLVEKLDIETHFNEGSCTVRISLFFVPDSFKIYFLFPQLETESLFNYRPLYFSRERFVNSCIYIHTLLYFSVSFAKSRDKFYEHTRDSVMRVFCS